MAYTLFNNNQAFPFSSTIEPWDYIAANKLGFLRETRRYMRRTARAGSRDDLLKAQHYLSKLLESTPIREQHLKPIRSAQVQEEMTTISL